MEVSEAKRLTAWEDENSRLVADQAVQIHIFVDVQTAAIKQNRTAVYNRRHIVQSPGLHADSAEGL
jgi:hypothetical protein